MIRGVHHISLCTTDMDEFVHFYRDLLGMKLDRISPLGQVHVLLFLRSRWQHHGDAGDLSRQSHAPCFRSYSSSRRACADIDTRTLPAGVPLTR